MAASADGRPLQFFNADASGGFVAHYAGSGEEYTGHECFISGVKCHADEARFGGIVIEVIEKPVIDRLLDLFAASIFSKARALAFVGLGPNQRKRVRKAITDDIRAAIGLIFPDVLPAEVSKAAHQEAQQIGVDLSTQAWVDQPKFDPGRTKFHLEHVVPISAIQRECTAAASDAEVLAILKKLGRVAWILKCEDATLTALRYRSKRPDCDAAYREAKIELLKFQRGIAESTLDRTV
jgi:hypothetical protein